MNTKINALNERYIGVIKKLANTDSDESAKLLRSLAVLRRRRHIAQASSVTREVRYA